MNLKLHKIMFCLLLGLSVSCNGLKESDNVSVEPVAASDDVSRFIETYLPAVSYSESAFSFEGNADIIIINSMDEFKAAVPVSVGIPLIDFDRYTLVLGQIIKGDPGYSFERQWAQVETDQVILNVKYKQYIGATPAVVTWFGFWGIYPKFPDLPVILNMM